ncbi:DUF4145 domain-containing protein [Rhizobium oryziradicis]|uniref:DUF4145 domain-containing protein n=1 Tax=Rhizobium oryziradicis TaxID=1867956 RepID=UPI001FDA4110|nr:DUF4145 domain-containing protein [Rhizobium oryziradicis]
MVTSSNYHNSFQNFGVGYTKYGNVGLDVTAIRCVNIECLEVTISVGLNVSIWNQRDKEYQAGDGIYNYPLRPNSMAKPQPDYIPSPILEDYYEACLISDKSPKSSATLARRCLQGMIRDFCGISKPTLFDEINELKTRVEGDLAPKGVDAETIEAIDAIRKIGNVGAHMQRDINIIVDVDPGEARALIELIEMLFKDWYVARHSRQVRLDRIRSIAAEKDEQISSQKNIDKSEQP